MSTRSSVQSKTMGSTSSIRLVLIPILGAMALLLVTTIGYVSLGAWTAHRAAVDQMEFDGGANRLIAGLFEILMERLATNNGLQDAEPADSGVLAEIERRRKAVRENFTLGLAMIEQRDFPDKQSLLGQLKTVMKKANDYRARADAGLKLARDNRDQELRTNYIPVITDQVNAALQVWYSALYSTAKSDPALARLATIKELGFNMRDIAGLERSNIAQSISAGTPIAPDKVAANAAYRAQVDALWNQLMHLTLDADTHPAIRTAIATAREHYFRDFRTLADEMKKASDAGGKYSMATLPWVDTTTPQLGKLLEVMYAASQASEQVTASALDRSLRHLLIMAAALVLVIGIALACLWIVSTRITQPLLRLSRVTERLAGNDTAVEIPDSGRADELGVMASALAHFRTSMIETGRLRSDQAGLQAEKEERQRVVTAAIGHLRTLSAALCMRSPRLRPSSSAPRRASPTPPTRRSSSPSPLRRRPDWPPPMFSRWRWRPTR